MKCSLGGCVKIGVIGGSGLDDPKILKDAKELDVKTPYGEPSSPLTIGKIEGVEVVLLSRHGRKHQFSPTIVPNKANIAALKAQGCTHIIATTAVGSLRAEIGRGHFVVPDQFIDFTRRRDLTFHERFDDGMKHTPMADPFDEKLRKALVASCKASKCTVHGTGTVVTIEGPRFSTRAESRMFRAWGADIINMSTAPECILANEAGIPYAAIAMSTDYDCWKEDEAPVTWEQIIEIFNKNVEKVKKVLLLTIKTLGEKDRNKH
jgi:5'-methylthioadenosine phosphorylase